MKKILYLLIGAGILLACSGINKTASESEVVSQCLQNFDYQYQKLHTKSGDFVLNEVGFKVREQ